MMLSPRAVIRRALQAYYSDNEILEAYSAAVLDGDTRDESHLATLFELRAPWSVV